MAYYFENIKLEKGMYGRSGRSFSQTLEELDPSEHYRGTPLEGLDAFQRQLKRFDIHVKGAGSDMVEKFFHTSDSAVLFPEFVSRVVRQGMEEESILPAITATVTRFDGMDYRSIASVPSEEDKKLRRVEEGARIPETTVRTQENLVHLRKRGRMLVASYEAIRFQRLDLFSVTLRQIGAYIGRMHLEDAIAVLRDGDGNENAAAEYTIGTTPITGTKGTLTYDALLEFWSQFDPYTMNTMLVGSDVMLAMLKLDEFQNPLTGLNFQGTGTLTTPLGAKLLRTSAMPAGILIGLDKNYALEQICGSEVTVEYDKLIDRQLERAAITSISGFAKLFTEASKVLVV
ncbi:MAG TPA: phage major capsid protein [Candidatus Oscillibacter excrementigallinarum]|uniref:Phage major capsid protein n=1 Tax=Candidatus Oscillibacter excrementigallinarum TaxID=2838716 RepID=A0A9D2RR68_9FIRM|nr:phage major capsid protein [Candidatus Oscillibacter excrementigallinarum]